MYFYGSYKRKHILLGTHTGKPLLVAKSCPAHLLRIFQSINYSSAHKMFPSRQQPQGRLQNVPTGKEHVPSKLLLLWQALFNVGEIGCIIY